MSANPYGCNSTCNTTQIPKNLPLKKRRAYLMEPSAIDASNGHDENYFHHSSPSVRQSYPVEDPFQIRLPSAVVSTPPPSPHVELMRQHYAQLLANATNAPQQHLYPPASVYECMLAQKLLAQQFLENYRVSVEQQYRGQQGGGYTGHEDKRLASDVTIDEHFRKSLGSHYDRFSGGFLTPDTSSSNSSPVERTPVDSIEEHFARSLAKFRPASLSSDEGMAATQTESIVDDHFAKALGASTWERLRDKS